MSEFAITSRFADRQRDERLTGNVLPPAGTPAGNVLTAQADGTSAWNTPAASGGITTFFDSTLGANAASIDSGAVITSGKLFLVCVIYVRTNVGTAFDTVGVRLNNDATAVYDQSQEQNTNAAVSGSSQVAQNQWNFNARGGGSAGNYASCYTMVIPAYDQTTFFKTAISFDGSPDTAVASENVTLRALGYRSTAAVTRVTVTALGAPVLVTGSRLTVVGVG